VERKKPPIEKALRSRMTALNERIRESDNLSRALRAGEVDAVVVLKKDGADILPIRTDEPLYRTMVEELPQGVATVLVDGTIVYANRHLIFRIGQPADKLLGRNLIDFVAEADQTHFRAMLRRALTSSQELETTFQWTTEACPVLALAIRLPVPDADAIGLSLVDLRDQHARRAAEESSRSKDELLAAVSHELRTPLTSMMGWVQLLEIEFAEDARISDALGNLKSAVLAESAIVNDLLEVSRTTRGWLPITLEQFDVLDAVRTAASFVTIPAKNKRISLTLDLPQRPIPVHGDPDRLRQVFVNLLSNAIKFTESSGTVVLTVRCDDAVIITVTDSGRGISQDFLPYVFEPFRRGAGTSQFPGLGIGLAIARSLVEAHGGTISVASEGLGHGATFTIRLPLGQIGKDSG